MKLKTSELNGAQLDWAVAKCEGVSVQYDRMNKWWETTDQNFAEPNDPHVYAPTIYWEQGGPIIEREKMSIRHDSRDARGAWYAVLGPNRFLSPDFEGSGSTPLIAAMRCYVASKLGDEIEVPEEVCNES